MGVYSINSSIARLPLTSFRQERWKNKQREREGRGAEILNLSLKFKQTPINPYSHPAPNSKQQKQCPFPRTSRQDVVR